MKRILFLILMFVCLVAKPQGLKQSGWTTTTDPNAARTALGEGNASVANTNTMSIGGSAASSTTATNVAGAFLMSLISPDDWMQKNTNYISPPVNAAATWDRFSFPFINQSPIWHASGQPGEYVFNEGFGDPIGGVKCADLSLIPVPNNCTSMVFSAFVKITPDTNNTSWNYGWYSSSLVTFTGMKTLTLTPTYQQIFITNGLQNGGVFQYGTNVNFFGYGAGFMMSNICMTYYPPPTNYSLKVPHYRMTVLQKNIAGGATDAGNDGLPPFHFTPSGNSTIDFDTTATNITIETTLNGIDGGFDGYMFSVNGGPVQTNLIPATPMEGLSDIALPPGQVNHVRIWNDNSFTFGINPVTAIYYPQTTSLRFSRSQNDHRILAIGDSILQSAGAKGAPFNYALETACTFCGNFDCYNIASAAAALDYAQQAQLISYAAAVNPDIIYIEYGINNYGFNTPTNVFYQAYFTNVDALHARVPNAVIVCQVPIASAQDDTVPNSLGYLPDVYRSLIRSGATNSVRASYVHLAESAGWFNNPQPIVQLHPDTSGCMKYAWFIATNLEYVILSANGATNTLPNYNGKFGGKFSGDGSALTGLNVLSVQDIGDTNSFVNGSLFSPDWTYNAIAPFGNPAVSIVLETNGVLFNPTTNGLLAPAFHSQWLQTYCGLPGTNIFSMPVILQQGGNPCIAEVVSSTNTGLAGTAYSNDITVSTSWQNLMITNVGPCYFTLEANPLSQNNFYQSSYIAGRATVSNTTNGGFQNFTRYTIYRSSLWNNIDFGEKWNNGTDTSRKQTAFSSAVFQTSSTFLGAEFTTTVAYTNQIAVFVNDSFYGYLSAVPGDGYSSLTLPPGEKVVEMFAPRPDVSGNQTLTSLMDAVMVSTNSDFHFIQQPNKTPFRVVVSGDSIVAPTYVDMPLPWPTQMRNRLGSVICDCRASDQLAITPIALIAQRIAAANPTVWIDEYGRNDYNYDTMSAAQFAVTNGMLVDAVHKICPQCRIFVLSPIIQATESDQGGGTLNAYRAADTNICSARPFATLISGNVIVPSIQYLEPDGVHPSESGSSLLSYYVPIAILTPPTFFPAGITNAMTATGFTNNSGVDLYLYNFAGTLVVFSNSTPQQWSYSMGTFTSQPSPTRLETGQSVTGTGCSATVVSQ